jgi:hypothetical protein
MSKAKDVKGSASDKQMRLDLTAPKPARVFTFPSKQQTGSSSQAEADALKRVLAHADSLGKKV